jgi:5-formyltetrahydrofolate cyclo-ligase
MIGQRALLREQGSGTIGLCFPFRREIHLIPFARQVLTRRESVFLPVIFGDLQESIEILKLSLDPHAEKKLSRRCKPPVRPVRGAGQPSFTPGPKDPIASRRADEHADRRQAA